MSSAGFNEHTTAEQVASTLQDQIKGKNVLLVGAAVNSLGGEFLRVIAPYAKTIWVVGRSEERLQVAIDSALSEVTGPKPDVHIVKMDMSSFESIREGCAQINAQGLPVNVLVQNIMVVQTTKVSRSAEGFEIQFGAHHLGTFLLVSLLLPRLRQAGPGARVIAVSSLAHGTSPFRWDDPNYKLRPEEYESNEAYGHSKYANVAFTRELAKRLAKEHILAFTLNPGVVRTNGSYTVPREVWTKYAGATYLEDGTMVLPPSFPWKTIPEGTGTYVVAAFDPAITDKSGSYLVDCQIHDDQLSPNVTEENDARLWALSEELVGFKFL